MCDIILFIVCTGMLLVYTAFLVYEWIENNRKKNIELNCRYNFVMPAAYKIFCIAEKRFRPVLKDEVMERYRKLCIGKSDDEIRKSYILKHISLYLYTGMVCLILLLFTVLSCQQKQDFFQGYFIEKNDIGGEQKEINLKTDIDGLKREKEIIIPERKYSEDEIAIHSKRVKEYISKHYLGKNKSEDKIKTNLNLMRKVNGSMIKISWISSNEEVVSQKGKTDGRKILKPQNVELTAVLKYESYKEKIKFNITVLPIKKSLKENIWIEWNEKFKNAVEETKSLKYLKLPDKVRGKTVKYGVDRYSRLWQVLMAMVVLFFIVPFVSESVSKSKVSEREKQLKLAYPEMIEKFVLLINAGLSIKSAWIRISDANDVNKVKKDYLKEEMILTKRQMENGLSEEKAYEMFGRRTGLFIYMKFCTLLVQNLKKGNSDLIKILEYESTDIFSERKENAKILGEEASTRLLLPMMMMMVIIFAIILYAAFSGM